MPMLQDIPIRWAITRPPLAGPADGGASGFVGLPLDTAILVIEDEAMIAWMIESILEAMGFSEIALASSAADAVAAGTVLRPGLIISDINLGGGPDGVEASAALRATTAIPTLFVTAYADDATRERIADAIPDARILSKPIDETALQRAVREMLTIRRPH